MSKSRIESIGSYLPATEVTTDELMGRLVNPSGLDLGGISGIKKRRVYDSSPENFEDSFVLASKAAEDVLANSQYAASDLDVIISCSITRTRGGKLFCVEPSFALMLKNHLGASGAIHFDVSNACAGMLTGIQILDRMIRSGAVKRGMVVSGEQITPISETATQEISLKRDPQFASLTVGDAGAAVILDQAVQGEDACIEYTGLTTSAEGAEFCLGMPSDKTSGVALYTDNKQMHNADRFRLWTTRQSDFLESIGSTFAEQKYDYIVHHQFSGPAIEFLNELGEKEFGTKMPPRLNVLERYGNTASTSHVLVLHEYLKRGELTAGSRVLLVPAASGMVFGYFSVKLGQLAV